MDVNRAGQVDSITDTKVHRDLTSLPSPKVHRHCVLQGENRQVNLLVCSINVKGDSHFTFCKSTGGLISKVK